MRLRQGLGMGLDLGLEKQLLIVQLREGRSRPRRRAGGGVGGSRSPGPGPQIPLRAPLLPRLPPDLGLAGLAHKTYIRSDNRNATAHEWRK